MPLIRAAARAARELRTSIEDPGLPLTSAALAEVLSFGTVDSGVTVTPTSALSHGPVWRAVALISGLGGALPIHVFRRGSYELLPSLILDDPHPDLTPLEFWRLTYVHRCMWGNFYGQKIRNGAGQITWIYPIRPERVRVAKVAPTAANPSGKLFEVTLDTGEYEVLTPADIFHLPGLGYDGVCGVSPIRAARQAIGLGLAAEKYGARLFGSGSLLSGILQTEQRLDPDAAERLKTRWREKIAGIDNSHDVAVLDAGASFQPLTMPNDDAQFIESRRFQVPEVARFFGVPAFLLGETEKSTSWGTGLEQQARGFVTFDLSPSWLQPTEQRITKELLLPRDRYAKYNVEGLLRGDSAARAAFYTAMRQVGALSANEIRELEDRAPRAGADDLLQPLNMAPLGSNGTQGDASAPDDPANDN